MRADAAATLADDSNAVLPGGYSRILRSYVFGPSGFWTMAALRYAAKFDPFLSLDCAPTPSILAQSKERKGSIFAIWQPCSNAAEEDPKALSGLTATVVCQMRTVMDSPDSLGRLFAGLIETKIEGSEEEKTLALFCGDIAVCGFRGAFASRDGFISQVYLNSAPFLVGICQI